MHDGRQRIEGAQFGSPNSKKGHVALSVVGPVGAGWSETVLVSRFDRIRTDVLIDCDNLKLSQAILPPLEACVKSQNILISFLTLQNYLLS